MVSAPWILSSRSSYSAADTPYTGLVFPPQEDGIMKISAMHFLTNYDGSSVSLPRYRADNELDGIPAVLEAQLRKYMTSFLPELADRKWFETRLCW